MRSSVNAQALDFALSKGMLVISGATLQEFAEVIFRKKFDKYFSDNIERFEAISRIESNCLVFFPKISINACADPKDNMFLELAITAGASCIITGDQDLLILNPFSNIPIVSAANFLILDI